MSKCDRCPLLTEDRSCPGERSRFVCDNAHNPSLIAQLRSFGRAVVQHVAAGMPMATEAQKIARLAICQACADYNQGSCRICGCGLETKASWQDQACPVGKWGPITEAEDREYRDANEAQRKAIAEGKVKRRTMVP